MKMNFFEIAFCFTAFVFVATSSANDCWWTGCQKNDWAVRGCKQYNKTENAVRDCDNGNEYYCCSRNSETNPSTEPSSCWWTGCQKNDWAVRGCKQYNKTQKDIRDCDSGNEYYCCSSNSEADLSSQPSTGSTASRCLWSACQPTDWPVRGCPSDMKQMDTQSCGNEGDMYQCCFTNQATENYDEMEQTSGTSFTNFVKYSLMKSRNFTLDPDSLPCRSIDEDKQLLLKIKNEGIYLCDLCPNFPQKRLKNIFLNNVPLEVKSNLIFSECFGFCFDKKECMVFSYDHQQHACYLYKNTIGTYIPEAGWTTVIMTQPVGILEDWTYSRHTRITGNSLKTSKEENFQKCLAKCKTDGCNYVSYSLQNSDCLLYSNEDEINYIDLNYGFITAIRISSIPIENDVSSRFIEEGDDILLKNDGKVVSNSKCNSLKNDTHSAFYAKECHMSDSAACDATSGCKRCYYPEKVETFVNLPICPDSEFIAFKEARQLIQRSMKLCLKEQSCIGVAYNSDNEDINQLTFDNIASIQATTRFLLRYPTDNNSNQKIMTKYDLILNYEIARLSMKPDSWNEIQGKSFRECTQIFESNKDYIRMSYSQNLCKISSEEVKILYKEGKYLTLFKKPALTSPLIHFVRTPAFIIPKKKSKITDNQCENCEVTCAQKCSKDYSNWCSHFSLKYSNDKGTCFFYELFDERAASSINLETDGNSHTFTRISTLDFTLDSLNKLNPFQPNDIYNCFQSDTDSAQTQTSLTLLDTGNNSGTELSIRRKRGFFDFLKKAAKAVSNFVVETVKDVVKPIVDTAKGVVNTVKNVVKGDFNKAKESFVNIPIVKDVKNVVDLGKAVVTGDWDTAKQKGIDLLQSQVVNVATSVIPIGGKVIGTGLKTIGKQLKKTTSKVRRSTKKKINEFNGNNKKVKKKPDNDRDKQIDQKRNQCNNRRPKRATSTGTKRKRPGDCSDDDDDNSKRCNTPNINRVNPDTMSGCKNVRLNSYCEYECKVGFEEPRARIKCIKEPNKKLALTPRPTCDPIDCQNTPFPLIVLETPQISNFGKIEFGKHLTAMVILFNKQRRLPVWSVALHQSNMFGSNNYNTLKATERASHFTQYPCSQLRSHQAKDADYTRSGYDKGHLTPANVARWSLKAKSSSNTFINIAPQDRYSNQQPWRILEAHVECFSKTKRSLVATGICSNTIETIGPDKLDVPSCYWKLVCYKDENSREQVVGFYSDNSKIQSKEIKLKRDNQIFTPRSQSEIKQLVGNIQNPWLLSAKDVNKGRPIQVGIDPTVWFPVNPFDCDKALELSQPEKDGWNDAFLSELMSKLTLKDKKDKKPKTTSNKRHRRQADGKLTRGCHSDSELRNMMSLLFPNVNEGGEKDENEISIDDEGGSSLVSVQKCNKRIVGYYTSWGDKKIEGRQLRRLTHLIYAFLEMKEDGTIDVGNPDRANSKNVEEDIKKARERLENLMQLAELHPEVKVMFAVGGWENSQYFSAMAATPQKRLTFIGSIVKMIERYGFDGVDIDWEYPVTGGANEGTSQDKQNYVLLMKEIRVVLDNLASETGRNDKYLLSFAGAAGQWTLDPGFDLPGLLKYADFANIMSYDFFGAWASKWGAYTGPPSPLYFGMPPGFSGKTNLDWTIKYYTCKTNLPHKLNIGIPFYGRYWKNVGAPVDGKDGMWRLAKRIGGKYEGGYVPWNKIQSEYLSRGYELHFHEKSKTPYAWNPASGTFLGYENEKSLQYKVKYAEEKNVGGLMIWSLELDDDDLTLLKIVSDASLCKKTNPKDINFKCSPIDEKRWWTPEDGDDKAGLCGKSAPLYKGYYPVCDPDDPGYSCCGPAGYCGTGEKFCDCPTCKNYRDNPDRILDKPIKPSVPVTWYLLNDPDGKRGRCGRKIPKINGVYPICNPDDENAFCCSNGGYCGSKDEFCKCNGCINFKTRPNYRYGPKKWWEQADGKDKEGKCGPTAPKVDGIYEAECEPNTKFNCCSENGYCGSGKDYCDCPKCKKFT